MSENTPLSLIIENHCQQTQQVRQDLVRQLSAGEIDWEDYRQESLDPWSRSYGWILIIGQGLFLMRFYKFNF